MKKKTDETKAKISASMLGKTNRQIGDEPREATMHLRMTVDQKMKFIQQSRRREMSLTAWAMEALEKYYDEQQKNDQNE